MVKTIFDCRFNQIIGSKHLLIIQIKNIGKKHLLIADNNYYLETIFDYRSTLMVRKIAQLVLPEIP